MHFLTGSCHHYRHHPNPLQTVEPSAPRSYTLGFPTDCGQFSYLHAGPVISPWLSPRKKQRYYGEQTYRVTVHDPVRPPALARCIVPQDYLQPNHVGQPRPCKTNPTEPLRKKHPSNFVSPPTTHRHPIQPASPKGNYRAHHPTRGMKKVPGWEGGAAPFLSFSFLVPFSFSSPTLSQSPEVIRSPSVILGEIGAG